MTSNISSY